MGARTLYDKDADHERLREPGKFQTLDTGLLAALTKIARGELSRQVLNFKETETTAGRAVRGRPVLFMFNQRSRAHQELGALYSVEDLLRVRLTGDDLTSYIHNWDAMIADIHESCSRGDDFERHLPVRT